MPFEMHSFSGEALDSVQVDTTSHLGSGDEKSLNDVQDFDAISTIITQLVIVKAAYLESRRSRVRAPLWPLSFKETKCFFSDHS